jgi:hypothetical protein
VSPSGLFFSSFPAKTLNACASFSTRMPVTCPSHFSFLDCLSS